ncbi:MAG: nucleotidyl transferase AbiEii/AbiGii toxin family protein [Nanoarchaeota archaeon]|nr:nucleotidyl transferase AbiEii/AbiGii toxin family protein [Nanoarchaeota archaeon]MBU4299612.1 nucleotidyl transferase AbiEii/AbiGii toxin family protein [Nanoarchaeota archaeon]MBU4451924.1 nucleotidyl transferase AbiEii/AbiGii toxin family protein [Nanoarchaeota archaeon]MCG2723931.1 nucleotidyl transferase AbiEii/AbiGii toxin family protein [archaeon]
MIRKEELVRIADAKKLSMKNAEKDYLLELLLFAIFSESGDSLLFKGGTALYKFYSLNRFSEDLDFTINKRRVDIEKVVQVALRRLSALGIEGKSDMEKYGNEINARLLFKGPLYNGSKESMAYVAINCSLREKPIAAKKELFVPFYREIPSFDVFVMGAEEILAEKVRAIYSRNKARDVYDIWFLIKRGVAPDMRMIEKKLKVCKLSFSKKAFAEKLEEKSGLFVPDLSGLIMGELPDFKKIKAEVLKKF